MSPRPHRLAGLLAAFLAIAAPAPAVAAERPSFDCRAARSAREVATCLSPRLARADRAMAEAYAAARRRLAPAARAILVEHQRAVLAGLDAGFERLLFDGAPPRRVRATVRLALAERWVAIADLTERVEGWTRVLAGLRPAAGRFAGAWHAPETILTLEARADGTFKADFHWEVWGRPHRHCGFSAVFRPNGEGLVSDAQDGVDDASPGRGRLVLRRDGDILRLRNDTPRGDPDTMSCGHDGALERSLFSTRGGEP